MPPRRFLDSLRRAFRWHRRGFAALLVAVSVIAGLNAIAQRDSSGAAVVVAARTIAGGAEIAPGDLAVVRLPPAGVAEGAVADTEALVGRIVVAEVPARRVLTASDLLDGSGTVAPGSVALPVRFGQSAAVSLLRVGARIDILGPTAEASGYGVVAAGVRVVAIPGGSEPGLLGGGEAALVLVEVTTAQATQIAAAAAAAELSFALR